MPTLAEQIAPQRKQPEGLGGWLSSIADEAMGAFERYGRRSGAQRDASLALLNQASAPGTDPIMGAGQKLLGLAGLITHPLAFFPTREEWDQRLQEAGNDGRVSRSIGGFLSDLPSLIDPQMAAGGAGLTGAMLITAKPGGGFIAKASNAEEAANLALAKSRGFNTEQPYFHSTTYAYDDYVPSKYRGATYFGQTPEDAARGASAGGMEHPTLSGPTVDGAQRAGANIRPVFVRGNIFSYDNPPDLQLPEKLTYGEYKNIVSGKADIQVPGLSEKENATFNRWRRDAAARSYDESLPQDQWSDPKWLLEDGSDNVPEFPMHLARRPTLSGGPWQSRAFGYDDIEGPDKAATRSFLQKLGFSGTAVNDEAGMSVAMFNPADDTIPTFLAASSPLASTITNQSPLLGKMVNKADDVQEFIAYKGARPYTGGPVLNGSGKVKYEEPLQLIEKWESPSTHLGGGYAGFFSSSPEVASRFAGLFNPGAVYRTKIKFNNPYVIDAGGRSAKEYQFTGVGGQGPDEVISALKNSKHDGVIIRNTADEGDVYIPKHNAQISDYRGGD